MKYQIKPDPTAKTYALAGKRQGFDFSDCERVDCPPNSGGHRYTEFRTADGSLKGVVMTALVGRVV